MSNKVIIKNSFVMPYIDDTVDVTVSDTKDLSPNCWLWNESVGYLQVIKYSPYSDIITLENIGRKENALHGTVFPTCMEFLISAPTALDLYNNMSTCLAADFNSPSEGQEALMSVDSTYVMKADDQIIVDREYRYLIVEVINSTTLKVRNEGMGKEGIIEVGCDSCVPVQVVSKLNCCPIPSGDLISNTSILSIADGIDALLSNAIITLDTDLSKYNNTVSKFITLNDVPRGTLSSSTTVLGVSGGNNNVLGNISLSLDTDLSKYNNTTSAFITLGDIPRGNLFTNSTVLTVIDGTNNVLDNIELYLDTDLSKYNNTTSQFLSTSDKKNLISTSSLLTVTNGTGATLENTSLDLDTDLSKYDNTTSQFLSTSDKKNLTSTSSLITVTNGTGATLENTSLNLDTDLSLYDNSSSKFISVGGIPSGALISNSTQLSVSGGSGATLSNVNLTLDTDLSQYDNSTSDFVNSTQLATKQDVIDANNPLSASYVSGLATVATSGDYGDLLNTPTIPTVNDATLTIQKNSTDVGTFTANASSNATIDITVPTDTNDLTNGAGYITSGDIPSGDLSSNSSVLTVTDGTGATLSNTSLTLDTDLSKYDNTTSDFVDSNALATKQDVIDANNKLDYSLIANTPTIPTVNDATLTIQKNSSNVGTFTANASSNVTVDITVPTDTNDLTNGAGYITSASLPTVNDATLTIQKNSSNVGTFTANASSNTTIDITVPTDTNDLTNGAGFITLSDIPALPSDTDLSNYDNSNSGFITSAALPTVNDATLTIQKNSTDVGTFTANASSNVTIDISVPTDTNDLTNGAGFITSSSLSSYLPLAGGQMTGDITVSGNISLGDSTQAWNTIYVGSIKDNSNTIYIGGNDASIFYFAPDSTAATNVLGTSSDSWEEAYIDKFNPSSGNTNVLFAAHIWPNSDNTYNLGDSSSYWKSTYSKELDLSSQCSIKTVATDNALQFSWVNTGVTPNENAGVQFVGDCVRAYSASSGDKIDLGSQLFKWRDGYLSGKLYLGAGTNNGLYLNSDTSHSYIKDITGNTVEVHATSSINLKAGDSIRVRCGTSTLRPEGNNNYDLGDTSHHWRNLYTGSIYFNSVQIYHVGTDNKSLQIMWQNGNANVAVYMQNATLRPFTTNTLDLGDANNRWRTIYTNNNVNVSDARIKDNIENLENGLEKINSISVKSYTLNGHDEGIMYGFIAQDELERNPELVVVPDNYSEEENGGELGYMPNNVLFLAVKAIQELSSKVDELNAKIEVLESKL